MKSSRLLQRLYNTMHNWFEIGVFYDWDMNPQRGKVWRYKDCAGTEIKRVNWEEFAKAVNDVIGEE